MLCEKKDADIKLGIIGLSDGNGHPYSWSAIFNGYAPNHIDTCPFKAIPKYLKEQCFPEAAIEGFRVTHIWTQDIHSSQHIAQLADIDHVTHHYHEMVGNIDALLLARDDAEQHYEFAKPFLEAGIPIYIDKPIATNIADFEKIRQSMQYDWQVFSCSAVRFASAFLINNIELETLGEIAHANLAVPKSWNKYIIHVIDPFISLLGDLGAINHAKSIKSHDTHHVFIEWKKISASLTAYGPLKSPIEITLYGRKKTQTLTFKDPFNAFKRALLTFCQSIQTKKSMMDWLLTKRMIELIEVGNNHDT